MLHDLRIKYKKVPGDDEIISNLCFVHNLYIQLMDDSLGEPMVFDVVLTNHPCDF